jgi:hypothetical protein
MPSGALAAFQNATAVIRRGPAVLAELSAGLRYAPATAASRNCPDPARAG